MVSFKNELRVSYTYSKEDLIYSQHLLDLLTLLVHKGG